MYGIGDLLSRLSSLAPNWDPSPVLQQLGNTRAQGSTPQQPGQWDFLGGPGGGQPMAPFAAPGAVPPEVAMMPNAQPNAPQMQGGGPVPPPLAPAAGAGGAVPFNPQQLAAMQQMMGRGQQQGPQAPAVAPQGPRGNIQFSPMQLAQSQGGPMGLAQILGRR